VQATWNLHERSAEPALVRAHGAGLGVIVKEAMANGRLAPPAAPPALRAAAEGRGVGTDALALAAALARPWADVVLTGAVGVDMLRSNLAAAGVRWDDALDAALADLREPAEAYWARRSDLNWD
jgi:aryl-alcohol dehydrogenase-like predicted oxidoreductase